MVVEYPDLVSATMQLRDSMRKFTSLEKGLEVCPARMHLGNRARCLTRLDHR